MIRRVAILGLYNSGSTAVAGMLHRLGVNLGPPFWATSGDDDPTNYYEPFDLSWHLRRWWREPDLTPSVTAEYRARVLNSWAELQDAIGPTPVGAKHPLLSLCVDDLLTAWGADTHFLWAWRPLADSVAGLQRRGWFAGQEWSLQGKLWDALVAFERQHPALVRVDWNRVRLEPREVAGELAALLELEPTDDQLAAAAAFVRTPPTPNPPTSP